MTASVEALMSSQVSKSIPLSVMIAEMFANGSCSLRAISAAASASWAWAIGTEAKTSAPASEGASRFMAGSWVGFGCSLVGRSCKNTVIC